MSSRLEQEYVVAVVINRSGIDSGEVDYSIPIDRFEKLRPTTLKAVIEELNFLKRKFRKRLLELGRPNVGS